MNDECKRFDFNTYMNDDREHRVWRVYARVGVSFRRVTLVWLRRRRERRCTLFGKENSTAATLLSREKVNCGGLAHANMY